MATMYFPKTVKYRGTKYPSNTPFKVDDSDVDDLKLNGGWVVNEPVATNDNTGDGNTNGGGADGGDGNGNTGDGSDGGSNADDGNGGGEPTLEELREIAKELGIEYKGNWGVKKLTDEIIKAQESKN